MNRRISARQTTIPLAVRLVIWPNHQALGKCRIFQVVYNLIGVFVLLIFSSGQPVFAFEEGGFNSLSPATAPIMQQEVAANEHLRNGIAAFPSEPALHRALGMLYFQCGETSLAHEQIAEVLRLSPNDRQATFILVRLGSTIHAKQPEVYP